MANESKASLLPNYSTMHELIKENPYLEMCMADLERTVTDEQRHLLCVIELVLEDIGNIKAYAHSINKPSNVYVSMRRLSEANALARRKMPTPPSTEPKKVHVIIVEPGHPIKSTDE